MKRLVVLSILLSFYSSAFAQSLEGEWQGKFTTDGWLTYPIGYIALTIRKTRNETYEIYSFTRMSISSDKDTVIICAVDFEKIDDRTFKLTESKSLNANLSAANLQTMMLTLKEKKGKLTLKGRWASPGERDALSRTGGSITFTRKK